LLLISAFLNNFAFDFLALIFFKLI